MGMGMGRTADRRGVAPRGREKGPGLTLSLDLHLDLDLEWGPDDGGSRGLRLRVAG